jgi:hypothetical protein
MPPERIDGKAARLLVTHSVLVYHVEGATVEATVAGDHDTYATGYDSERGWYCGCPPSEPVATSAPSSW